MIEFILTHYKDDLMAMAFAYIGIISIIMMFLPKDNFIKKFFMSFASIFTTYLRNEYHRRRDRVYYLDINKPRLGMVLLVPLLDRDEWQDRV